PYIRLSQNKKKNGEKKMVDYSEEEKALLDKCIGYYKGKVIPDENIDRNDPRLHIAAVDYCHSYGQFVRTAKQHDLKDSILEKNGVAVESDEVRQIRLAKERLQKISDKRIDKLATIEAEKKAELQKAIEAKEAAKQKIKDAEARHKAISSKEARAKAAQQKAETIAKEQADEIKRLKAKLEKKKDVDYLAEAAAELAKGEEAKLTVDPPVEVITKEPPAEVAPIEPEPVKEEKTVDELIEDLKEE
ncbi:unnamed protein product, partial [marine sediment metagenome]